MEIISDKCSFLHHDERCLASHRNVDSNFKERYCEGTRHVMCGRYQQETSKRNLKELADENAYSGYAAEVESWKSSAESWYKKANHYEDLLRSIIEFVDLTGPTFEKVSTVIEKTNISQQYLAFLCKLAKQGEISLTVETVINRERTDERRTRINHLEGFEKSVVSIEKAFAEIKTEIKKIQPLIDEINASKKNR